MTPELFISEAIEAGQREGIAALDPDQRLVYLISEAECLCDMEGIDTFLNRYGPDWIGEAAAAFEAVGAVDIAAEILAAPLGTPMGDLRLDRLNHLITERVGYDFEAIREVVATRMSKHQSPNEQAL